MCNCSPQSYSINQNKTLRFWWGWLGLRNITYPASRKNMKIEFSRCSGLLKFSLLHAQTWFCATVYHPHRLCAWITTAGQRDNARQSGSRLVYRLRVNQQSRLLRYDSKQTKLTVWMSNLMTPKKSLQSRAVGLVFNAADLALNVQIKIQLALSCPVLIHSSIFAMTKRT